MLIQTSGRQEVLGSPEGFAPDIYGASFWKKFKKGIGKVGKLYTAPARFALKKAKGKKFRMFGGAQTWENVLMGFAGTTWEEAAAMSGVDIYGSWFSKVIKKIGKFTAPITTKLAKTFLPSSIVDAAAHLDPTKKGNIFPAAIAAVQTLITAKQEETPALMTTSAAIQKNAIMNTLKNPLVIGVAAVGAGIIVLMLTKKRRR